MEEGERKGERVSFIRFPCVQNQDHPHCLWENLLSKFSQLMFVMTTPYRSTIAITRLARFIAKSIGLVFSEGEFGSDVEGTKPIFFDVSKEERIINEALGQCYHPP